MSKRTERDRQKEKKWRQSPRGKAVLKAAQLRWRAKNPGEATRRAQAWRAENPEKAKAKQREIDRRYKTAAYEAYGGFICACCGETKEQFLSIDHINNDGAKHRKEVPHRGLTKWLKANDYPPGFQILCMNCNFGKSKNGGICPHKISEPSTTIARASTAKRLEMRSPVQLMGG